jgi:peptidoglycan/LPS O-acetylase OafA/YrhL
MNTSAKRDSRFELLRIVAAVMICYSHITINVQEISGVLKFNYYLEKFYVLGGKFGVNLFLLIGCWFMADSVSFDKNINRIKKIFMEMFFYGTMIGIADLVLFQDMKGIKDWVMCYKYWFTFAYIAMLVIIIFADKLKKFVPAYLVIFTLIFLVVAIYGILNPADNRIWIFDKAVFIGPTWFTYVFLMMKRYKNLLNDLAEKIPSYIFFVLFMFFYASMYLVYLRTQSNWVPKTFSPFCIGAALSLFMFFLSMEIGYNRVINELGAVTYATYLIQVNCKLSIAQLLKGVFTDAADTPYFFLICTLHVISIFVIAIILNKIYCCRKDGANGKVAV